MSLDYTACYVLNGKTDFDKLKNFFAGFNIHYSDAHSKYFFEDEILCEQSRVSLSDWETAKPISWEMFIDLINGGDFLNSIMYHKDFQFTFGFLTDAQKRYALIEITDDDIELFERNLEASGTNIRRFFVGFCQMLQAEAFVLGIDIHFEDLRAFLDGTLESSKVKQDIRMAIRAPHASLEQLKQSGGREIEIDNEVVVTRNFMGAPLL